MLKYSKICVERGQHTSTKFEILKGVSISFCSLSILLNITLIMLHYVTSPSPFHSNIAQWIVPNAWSSSTQVFGFFRLRHFILCTFNIKFVCSKHGLSCQYLYPVCNNSSILHVDSPNISTAAKTVIHLKLNQSATLSAKTEEILQIPCMLLVSFSLILFTTPYMLLYFFTQTKCFSCILTLIFRSCGRTDLRYSPSFI